MRESRRGRTKKAGPRTGFPPRNSPPEEEVLRSRLARRGLRLTRQRQVVLEALRSLSGHPDAHQIYQRARRMLPRVSLGTVYRALGVLRDAGVIEELHFGKAHGRYEEARDAHHHVVCTVCGRVEDLPRAAIGDLTRKARGATRFEIQEQRVELYGLCPACRG
ncbi:MAG: Fur family transcriptional regulator [Acidobacteriota bacterium]